MMTPISFRDYNNRLVSFIREAGALSWPRDDEERPVRERRFGELAVELFALQFAAVPVYRRLCEGRGVTPGLVRRWDQIPPIPTAAFKSAEITSLESEERVATFHSSGTTGHACSRHHHSRDSLEIYETSLLTSFEHLFLRSVDDAHQTVGGGGGDESDRMDFLILTPPPERAPHSSLVHMFQAVRREFGTCDSTFTGILDGDGGWTLDLDWTVETLKKSARASRPLVVLGTAFSFVHLIDHCASQSIRFSLPEGSRALETGGYKGRSRTVPRAELHEQITRSLGVPGARIVCEYGMSELSSQAYACPMRADSRSASGGNIAGENESSRTSPRHFRFPPWARARLVSPETLQPVAEGETGLIQVFDLANVRSVLALQTEDLGVRRGDGFELLGRAPQAEPRGCSLMLTGGN